jgi:hypothetical protein
VQSSSFQWLTTRPTPQRFTSRSKVAVQRDNQDESGADVVRERADRHDASAWCWCDMLLHDTNMMQHVYVTMLVAACCTTYVATYVVHDPLQMGRFAAFGLY